MTRTIEEVEEFCHFCDVTLHMTKDVKTIRSGYGHFIDESGCQIAKCTFKNGILDHYKSYSHWHWPLHPVDYFFLRFQRWLLDDTLISPYMYNRIIFLADIIQQKDLQEKQKWRKQNPKPHRKRLEGKSLKYIVTDLIMGNIEKYKDFEALTPFMKDVLRMKERINIFKPEYLLQLGVSPI
jgi:hypothetical protein